MHPELTEYDARLVDAYLRNYATKDDELLWAFSEVNEITVMDAERGWSITRALIAAAPDDQTLGYLAAGPLEDVLEVHGVQLMDRIESLAHHDKKFRQALSHVECLEDSMPKIVRDRINLLKATFFGRRRS